MHAGWRVRHCGIPTASHKWLASCEAPYPHSAHASSCGVVVAHLPSPLPLLCVCPRLSDQAEATLQESGALTSLALSPDSTHLLVNLSTHLVHLWNLGDALAPHQAAPWGTPGPALPHTLQPAAAAAAGVGWGLAPHPSSTPGPPGTPPPAAPLAAGATASPAPAAGGSSSSCGPQAAAGAPDLAARLPAAWSVEYEANEGRQGRYVVRSAFGGSHANFVVHGGEDAKVRGGQRGPEEVREGGE
jgi:hypothetical protein